MADSVQFNIEGLGSVLGKFQEVSYDIKRRGGRSSLRRAAKLLAGFAKENAAALDDPETGRSISDNINLRWNGKMFKRNGDLAFRVGVLQGAKLPATGEVVSKEPFAPTPHWRLKEFGTENMPADPFMRRALSEHIADITNEFVISYDKALDRAIKRAGKVKS